MNPELRYLFAVTAVTAAVTILLRALPFLAFGGAKKTPPFVEYLGKMLSPASIAMLVVYCYCAYFSSGRTLKAMQYGLPELSAGLLVVLLQLKWKNPLFSILAGTAVYMFWQAHL